jgi:hypothetical protein
MTRAAAWGALALFFPAPVFNPNAFFNADGSVTLTWSLPADPSVVGITIFRDNLDDGDTTIFEFTSPISSFNDTGASHHDSYRYWIHTRDAEGDLSEGVFIEIFDDDGDSSWYCSTWGAVGAGLPSAWLLAFAPALLLLLRRR